MIYRIALVAFLGAFSYILFSAGTSEKTSKVDTYNPIPPYSGGPGTNGAGDRTGSPLSGGGSCANCHGGGSFSPAIAITVLDGTTPVTSYVPGNVYTVRFTVTGGAPRYGFQGVALTTANNAAGTLNSPGANTQVTSIGGIPYVEHTSAVATTGIFTSQWTAPASGTGSIKIYGRGLASNSNGSTGGDNASSSVNITLTETIPTTISYPGNPFCVNEPNQTPVQTGTLGGTFSAPGGLSINPSTGVINIAASTQGSYQVDYTYSTGVTSFNVTIYPIASSSFALTICDNETYNFGSQVLDGTDAGMHTEVFQTVNGCDSTVQLNLSVTPSTTVTQSATICETETFVFNGQTLNASNAGLNTAIFQAVNGCDSIIQLNLFVLPTFVTNLSESICEDGTFDFNGQILDASNIGLNTVTLQSVDGCDSTINLTLNVQNIDNTVSNVAGVLTANQAGATYQWVDCDNNNAAISGATNASFEPLITGNYAVIITLNGCSETSACANVIVSGIEELSVNNSVIYPNPVIDIFEIKEKEGFGDITSITLLDSKGKLVQVISPEDQNTDISRLDAGTYFLKIVHATGESILSLVKK